MRAAFVLLLFWVTLNKRVGAQTSGCGTLDFYGAMGRISSPNYPRNYSNSLYCNFTIVGITSSTVAITFLAFDTETCCDRIQIFCVKRGEILNSPRYSGKELPPVFNVQSCSSIIVRFTTDGSVVASGFSLAYETLSRTIPGGFSTKPLNVFASVYSVDPIIFNCSSNTSYLPSWSLTLSGKRDVTLTKSLCLVSNHSPYSAWLRTESFGPGSCNIIISAPENQLKELGGVFICTDLTMISVTAVLIPLSLRLTSTSVTDSLRPTLSSVYLVQEDQLNIACNLNVYSTQPYTTGIYRYYLLHETIFFQFSVLESYWTTSNGDIIPGNSTTNTSSYITVTSPAKDVSSYTCNFNVSLFTNIANAATNFPTVLSRLTYTQVTQVLCRNFSPIIIGISVGAAVLVMVLLVVIVILLGRQNRSKKKTIGKEDHEQIRTANRYVVTNQQMADNRNPDHVDEDDGDDYETPIDDGKRPLPDIPITY